MIRRIREIYLYREMLFATVKKDLRTRYKASVLGFLWTYLNPLLMLLVYSIVFPFIMRVQQENYTMFIFVTLMPWQFFATAVQGSASSIINNSNLVKKIYFPREIVPISVATGALVNYCYQLVIIFLAMFFTGISFTINLLYLPIIILIQYILSLGFAFIFSSITVYFRDMEHILGIVMMAWFYVTPVLYSTDIFPQEYVALLYLNPLTAVIVSYRDIMFNGDSPNFFMLFYVFIFSIFLFCFGFLLFARLERNFAEEL